MQKIRKVVVTGLGSLTPIGSNNQAYWQGLVNGISGAAPRSVAKLASGLICSRGTANLSAIISVTFALISKVDMFIKFSKGKKYNKYGLQK